MSSATGEPPEGIANPPADECEGGGAVGAAAEMAVAGVTRSGKKHLSPTEQQLVLEWMLKGAGPGQACLQLGVTVEQFWDTLQDDPAFAAALQKLFDTLSQNVLAALYQSAMKGNASAQQFWLKQRPATHWTTVVPDDGEDTANPLSRLSDDQLVDECRAAGLDLPAKLAARSDAPSGEA